MVLNATFNTISVISWWSVLLLEETGENQRLPANQNEYHAQSRISRPFQIILTCCSFMTDFCNDNLKYTKGVIRSRISKDRHYNGQKKEQQKDNY